VCSARKGAPDRFARFVDRPIGDTCETHRCGVDCGVTARRCACRETRPVEDSGIVDGVDVVCDTDTVYHIPCDVEADDSEDGEDETFEYVTYCERV